jgi:hypothetical protein
MSGYMILLEKPIFRLIEPYMQKKRPFWMLNLKQSNAKHKNAAYIVYEIHNWHNAVGCGPVFCLHKPENRK